MQRSMTVIGIAMALAVLTGLFVSAGGNAPNTPAYYGGKQFRVTVKELEPAAAAAILARNSPLNSIYSCDGCEPDGHVFVKVIDAVENDGTSSLWRGVQIEFSPGYPCRQFRSNSEIASAVKAGEISLVPTGYVYRCQLVGPGR